MITLHKISNYRGADTTGYKNFTREQREAAGIIKVLVDVSKLTLEEYNYDYGPGHPVRADAWQRAAMDAGVIPRERNNERINTVHVYDNNNSMHVLESIDEIKEMLRTTRQPYNVGR